MADGKNWMQIVLMPVVVAGVGIGGTFLINRAQEKTAKERADADRQIKILEMFSQQITHSDQKQRLLGLSLLTALDSELAAKLAKAVSESETESTPVKRAADKVQLQATAIARSLPRVYVHIEGEEQRAAARAISDKLAAAGWPVPGIERVGNRAPATTQLRYFRKEEVAEAVKITKALEGAGVVAKTELIRGYETSEAIRPMHFELWFAPGQPEATRGTSAGPSNR